MDRMKELITLLNKANKVYYQENQEIMSNYEYDKLYDELENLEKETGIIFSNSPTHQVGEGKQVLNSVLEKVPHETPMLSLNKTKDVEVLKDWLGSKEGIISWKLDGLTVVLTYQGGQLKQAVTRGNGVIGELVTLNARQFENIPLEVPYKGKFTVRGEAVISYKDFEEINSKLVEEEKYKNPRNLASGSVRQLDPYKTRKRKVNFIAFELVSDILGDVTLNKRFEWLRQQGFDIVENHVVTKENLATTVQMFSEKIKRFEFPSDGLVVMFNDYRYGLSLGKTAKFPRNGLALKWKDEVAKTVLRNVLWQPSRTGVINPVAVFDSVELEGTTVNKATLNNVSFIENLQLGLGDEILVYKSNMIIPQVEENLTRSSNLEIPIRCPACGVQTEIRNSNGTKTLLCTNSECKAKLINKLEHFVSRNAMNIEGLSGKTLEFLINKGWVNFFADLFNLQRFKKEWCDSERFGELSVSKIFESIEKSRNTTLDRFLTGLGIPQIGSEQAKLLAKRFQTWEKFKEAGMGKYDFSSLGGFGDSANKQIHTWFRSTYIKEKIADLEKEIYIQVGDEAKQTKNLAGAIFVITGEVHLYKNRKELQTVIEAHGGKVTSAVSRNTNFLINNDSLSSSSKNKRAREFGIPIITEENFQSLL